MLPATVPAAHSDHPNVPAASDQSEQLLRHLHQARQVIAAPTSKSHFSNTQGALHAQLQHSSTLARCFAVSWVLMKAKSAQNALTHKTVPQAGLHRHALRLAEIDRHRPTDCENGALVPVQAFVYDVSAVQNFCLSNMDCSSSVTQHYYKTRLC